MDLIEKCELQGVTVAQLARLLGVHISSLYRWRTGDAPIPRHRVAAIKAITDAAKAGTLDLTSTKWHPEKRRTWTRRRPSPDLPPLAIPEPPRPMPPPTVLPAPAPSLWQRVGAAVRRVFGKS